MLAVKVDGADPTYDLGSRSQVPSGRQEMPGFAVAFEVAAYPASSGIEGQAMLSSTQTLRLPLTH